MLGSRNRQSPEILLLLFNTSRLNERTQPSINTKRDSRVEKGTKLQLHTTTPDRQFQVPQGTRPPFYLVFPAPLSRHFETQRIGTTSRHLRGVEGFFFSTRKKKDPAGRRTLAKKVRLKAYAGSLETYKSRVETTSELDDLTFGESVLRLLRIPPTNHAPRTTADGGQSPQHLRDDHHAW